MARLTEEQARGYRHKLLGAPPQWLSTHPSGKTRIKDIQKNLPKVMPLYERAVASKGK